MLLGVRGAQPWHGGLWCDDADGTLTPPKYGMRFWHLSVRNIITGDH